MRLTCPQCHTEYEVPDAALLGRARTLRCADCGTKWKAEPLPAKAELPENTVPEPAAGSEPEYEESPADAEPAIAANSAVEGIPIPPQETKLFSATGPTVAPRLPPAQPAPARARPNHALRISVLIVLLLIVIVLAQHRAIGQAWPPSLRLFNALGLR